MSEIEYARVKDKTNGHKLTMVRSAAESDQDAYQILKEAAVDHNGLPLPPEFPAPISGQKATDNTPKE